MQDGQDQSAAHTSIHRNLDWGQAWWGLLEVSPTRLRFSPVCIRAGCMLGRDRLGHSIQEMGLRTELTDNCNHQCCV